MGTLKSLFAVVAFVAAAPVTAATISITNPTASVANGITGPDTRERFEGSVVGPVATGTTFNGFTYKTSDPPDTIASFAGATCWSFCLGFATSSVITLDGFDPGTKAMSFQISPSGATPGTTTTTISATGGSGTATTSFTSSSVTNQRVTPTIFIGDLNGLTSVSWTSTFINTSDNTGSTGSFIDEVRTSTSDADVPTTGVGPTPEPPSTIPLPAGVILLLTGCAAFGMTRRRAATGNASSS